MRCDSMWFYVVLCGYCECCEDKTYHTRKCIDYWLFEDALWSQSTYKLRALNSWTFHHSKPVNRSTERRIANGWMNNNELIVVCTEIVMELYIVTSMRLFTSLYFYAMLHSPTALSDLSIDTSLKIAETSANLHYIPICWGLPEFHEMFLRCFQSAVLLPGLDVFFFSDKVTTRRAVFFLSI